MLLTILAVGLGYITLNRVLCIIAGVHVVHTHIDPDRLTVVVVGRVHVRSCLLQSLIGRGSGNGVVVMAFLDQLPLVDRYASGADGPRLGAVGKIGPVFTDGSGESVHSAAPVEASPDTHLE